MPNPSVFNHLVDFGSHPFLGRGAVSIKKDNLSYPILSKPIMSCLFFLGLPTNIGTTSYILLEKQNVNIITKNKELFITLFCLIMFTLYICCKWRSHPKIKPCRITCRLPKGG